MAQSRLRQLMSGMVSGTPASQIIQALSQHGGMSAAQIARHTGLARSTISTAVMYYQANGVLTLQPDDIAGIRAIYGSSNTAPSVSIVAASSYTAGTVLTIETTTNQGMA